MAGKKTAKKNAKKTAQPAAEPTKPVARKTSKKGAKKKSSKKSAASRSVEAQIGLDAIAIEGGLLSPSWLSRVAQTRAPSQSEADYAVPKGLTLRDEIGRYWRVAQAYWAEFVQGQSAGADPEALARRFVLGLLEQCLGFSSICEVKPLVIEERTYPIGRVALAGRVPIVIAPAGLGLDTPDLAFGEEKRRRSSFGLVQEYLNADEAALWGLVCDGFTLRVVRDNASLTRPAWLEADLARIFTEDRHAEFAALWLLIHESRFGRPGQFVTECALEAWRNAGVEEGTRARDSLRSGVEEALLVLGQGFLSHVDNQDLRAAIQSGRLTTHEYFNQLLRLVYRAIFLLTIEERGLLHPTGSDGQAQKLYAEGYSLKRLRDRAVRRNAHDRFSDVWDSVKIVFGGLIKGEPRLALPALAGIFAAKQCSALDSAKLENHVFLLAMFKLSWFRQGGALARVNWRDMGAEELGSVYESLLELVPRITKDGREFGWAKGTEAKGNARKTSGSYYTPDSLVQILLDSALEPVVADTIAKHPDRPGDALLDLAIVDPACGSGHFLLAAARRLASHVAELQVHGTPSAADYRHAVRQVVARCIYGVDLNPMAVDLCKVSLWMEAVDPGLPLTFLDSHIQHGNSLLGTTPELMAEGIPNVAWDPIEGDNKEIAGELKKRNKKAVPGQASLDTLWSKPSEVEVEAVTRAVLELDVASDADPDALAKKESQWGTILDSAEYCHQKFLADAWCSAFVWPKQQGPLCDIAAPTNELWWRLIAGESAPTLTATTVSQLAKQYRFFHWHLQFPQVFLRGGFNVVLANPPWERVTLKAKEWFAQRDEWIADAATEAIRARRIAELEVKNPTLFTEFSSSKRAAAGEKHFLRKSKVYPLCGKGDVNTFAVFAELGHSLAAGRAGLVLPTGIVTADTTQDYVAHLVNNQRLVSIYDFDNRAGIFPAVQGNVRFCLLTTSYQANSLIRASAQLRSINDLRVNGRTWIIRPADIMRINPNTLTIPLFPAERDAAIVTGIYDRLRCLDQIGVAYAGRWTAPLQRMLHMGDDSYLFRTEDDLHQAQLQRSHERWIGSAETYVPLLEAKLCHQYDHRAGTFDGIPKEDRLGTHPATRDMTLDEHCDPDEFAEPRYWVPESEVRARVGSLAYLLGFRDAVSAVADSRSLVATIIPPHGAGDTLKFFFPNTAQDAAFICAWFNSFATDFVFRLKAGGAHASFFLLRQLPIPNRDHCMSRVPWVDCEVLGWVATRVLELSFTAWALSGFASECGYDGPPFLWDPARRFLLCCELDAAFFHLYGLSRNDIDYVMETFPIVRKNDEKAHGEYRTKRVILEIYDAMTEAARTGKPYQTRLDPPPADPSVAHSPKSPEKGKR